MSLNSKLVHPAVALSTLTRVAFVVKNFARTVPVFGLFDSCQLRVRIARRSFSRREVDCKMQNDTRRTRYFLFIATDEKKWLTK